MSDDRADLSNYGIAQLIADHELSSVAVAQVYATLALVEATREQTEQLQRIADALYTDVEGEGILSLTDLTNWLK